jgi:MATE family multidrug resistance protein
MISEWRRELGEILRIAGPLAGAQLGYMVMATTDTVMMGKISADSIAAGGLSSAIGMLLVYVALGLLQSVQPIVAQGRGADDSSPFARTFMGGVIASLICTVPIMLILIELETILTALGEPPEIARLAGSYARAFSLAVPGILLGGTLRNYLAAFSRTTFVMAVSVSALGLNLLLNWMLIFGHLGAPALGLPGSGYATAIVAWSMTVALAIHLCLAKLLPSGIARLSMVELWRGLRRVVALGLPIAGSWWLEIGMFSCSSLLMGRFGPVALAAHQICINLVSLTYTVPSAISTAATVRVGIHVGARAPENARVAGLAALALGVSFMVFAAIVLLVFAGGIVGLYLDAGDRSLPEVQALGISMLAVAALFQVFDGTQCVLAGALRGLIDVRIPLLAAVIGYWLLGLPIGAGLALKTGLGPLGLWWGLAIGLIVVAVMLAARFHYRIGKLTANPPSAKLGWLAKL